MKVGTNPILPAHRILFAAALVKYQALLGLSDWRINLSDKLARKANIAEVKVFHPNRMATVYLGTDFGSTPITQDSIESIACHELAHVLVAELVNQITWGITDAALESAEHRVVHTVERLLGMLQQLPRATS
jgi:hypothetical protein